MGEFTTSSSTDFKRRLTVPEPKMHYLKKPYGFSDGMAFGNLGYQMQYSVESLEEQLVQEGNPHVLQLNAYSYEGDWKNPTSWHLMADGREVASGDGRYALRCFQDSAEAFRDVCRQAVERTGLPSLTDREYRLLKCAQLIARYEPFDDSSHTMGKREGRAQ